MINVLVVDDQNTIRQFLKVALESESDLKVVGLAQNGKEAVEKTTELSPDVIVMDINMPVMDGLSATRVISERFRETKILIFSLFDDDESLSNAIEMGAKGYLFKNTPPGEIVNAIRSAHQGYFQLGPGLLERYLYRFTLNCLNQKDAEEKKTSEPLTVVEHQNYDYDFAFSRMKGDIVRLEKSMVLNRSLVYLMFVFSLLLIFMSFTFNT